MQTPSYINALTTNNKVLVWERHSPTSRVCKSYSADWYFYVPHERGTYKNYFNEPLMRIDCTSRAEFNASKEGIKRLS